MDNLALLKSGQLVGSTHFKLARGLTDFPAELFDLAASLEILDLGNNHLTSLPDEFDQFQQLKILFLTNNDFREIPAVLARCPQLRMVSFKSNQLTTVAEHTLPDSVRWLILTDNQIQQLPDSLGKLTRLQKLMLAGNQLRALPASMAACHNLELIRLSANQLQALPAWLGELPRLAWLAIAGNPCCPSPAPSGHPLPTIDWAQLSLGKTLGEGASGVISEGIWQTGQGPEAVAIKLFKGAMTSDGDPANEMATCLAAGYHDHLVPLRGRLSNAPAGQTGLVFSLIPPGYKNLGQPPNFDTCTRDTYGDSWLRSPEILQVLRGIAAAAAHLHSRGILHGDLYAHNILVNSSGHSLLGDFGAASFYQPGTTTIAPLLEGIEVRAFGYLIEDLLTHCLADPTTPNPVTTALEGLQQDCLQPRWVDRPRFSQIYQQLRGLDLSMN